MSTANSSQDAIQPVSYKILYAISQILGITLIVYVFYWIVHFRGGFSFTEAKIVFNWHPLLMTIAFIYLLGNAVLHFRTFRNNKKSHLKVQHAVLHGSVLILVLFAAYAALASHLYASPPIPNFYSLHSWLGLVTVAVFLLQFAGGFVSFMYPELSAQYKETVAPYHVFFGIFTFVLAVVTAIIGFSEKLIFSLDNEYKQYPTEGWYGNLLGVLLVVYGGLIVYLVTKPEYKRCPRLEYEPLLGTSKA